MANPPVYEASYKWFIDNREIRGQNGFYYEIFNVTRAYHDKQVRCSVENTLGVAMGLKSIEVKCKSKSNSRVSNNRTASAMPSIKRT